MDMADIARRLTALEDIEAIRALKARYLYSCDRKDVAGMRGCFVDGEATIDFGPVGRFDNADALAAVFREVGCHEHMVEMHHGVNPQITLVDAQHASASWSLHYCLIDTRAQRLTQLGGYYEDEYRKVAGVWKISASRFVVTSTLALDVGAEAVKPLFAGRTPPVG